MSQLNRGPRGPVGPRARGDSSTGGASRAQAYTADRRVAAADRRVGAAIAAVVEGLEDRRLFAAGDFDHDDDGTGKGTLLVSRRQWGSDGPSVGVQSEEFGDKSLWVEGSTAADTVVITGVAATKTKPAQIRVETRQGTPPAVVRYFRQGRRLRD